MRSTPRRILLLGLLLNTAWAREPESPREYRDPANRFTIVVPAGWKLRALGDSVQIVRGDCYASVLIFPRTWDAGPLVSELSQKMRSQWSHVEAGAGGESTLAGLKATTASFSGRSPQGLDAILRLSGVTSNNTAYVVVIGGPKSELPKAQQTLAQIESSFRLLAGESHADRGPAPTLGVEVTDLTSEDAGAYGLSEPTGVLVVRVEENGPAQQAGVELHDVILAADDRNIDSAAMLQQVLQAHKPGDSIEIELLRPAENGKTERQHLKATVGGTQ